MLATGTATAKRSAEATLLYTISRIVIINAYDFIL
jgi:hypothetical protein